MSTVITQMSTTLYSKTVSVASSQFGIFNMGERQGIKINKKTVTISFLEFRFDWQVSLLKPLKARATLVEVILVNQSLVVISIYVVDTTDLQNQCIDSI